MYAVITVGHSQKNIQPWPTTFLIVAKCKSTLIGEDTEKSKVCLENCVLCGSSQCRKEPFKIGPKM